MKEELVGLHIQWYLTAFLNKKFKNDFLNMIYNYLQSFVCWYFVISYHISKYISKSLLKVDKILLFLYLEIVVLSEFNC